ncbi:nucleotidyltransferase-like protein [Maribacter vaceletii]|uniref:Nucleotidyltransferase-like protein n=1 Tax=Maribacter vaceletii TaxID=1206816 RepID=A0A495EC97_9FLAO|nr:sugar phosphate nucleotidyltransferase [Maribacter vaceletii]RKR14239.1 nucleotidyltransferase-like protein [Maribacter vaceletii]
MTLLLMAAGRGSRYGKLKQFDDLGPNGELLMEYSIFDAIEAGFTQIVVITQKDKVDFTHNHLDERIPEDIELDVIAQETSDIPYGVAFMEDREKPWGTAHAVWSARNVIEDAFVVINADDYYGKEAFINAAKFLNNPDSENSYGLVGYTLKETLSTNGSVSRGICKTDGDNNLIAINEHLKIEKKANVITDITTGANFSGEELVSLNFWVCQPEIFETIEEEFITFLEDKKLVKSSELYLPLIIKKIMDSGEDTIKTIPSNEQWFGITYAADREEVVQALKEKTDNEQYPVPMWQD